MTDSSGATAEPARRSLLEEGMSGDRCVLVAKAIAISIAAYTTLLSLPALLGAFARELALTDRQIGWVGSAELLGATCGTLIMAHARGRRMKQWLFAAAALVASGNLAASLTDGFGALVVCMWIVGLGAGLHAETVALFSASTAALGIFYLFTIPIILGVVSRLDPTGRSTVLGLTVASTGQAIGPGIAGSLVTDSNYLPLGIFAAACFAISILTVLAFLRRAATTPLKHL